MAIAKGKTAALVLGPVTVLLAALPLTAQAAPRTETPRAAAQPVNAPRTETPRKESLPSESEWLADVAPVAASLQGYLEQRLAGAHSGEKPAVVLDIDNTSLATHYDRGKAIEAILKATDYAHAHGAAVLFASYRNADKADATTRELTSAGYTVDGLCLKPEGDSPGKAKVKLGCRKKYEAEGYTLVANVGNRSTDFEGGHYEKGFKLPDYDGQLS
ncbi:acid phosphatase [Streptomyces sp. NRRL F-4489]|nr:acid phosphatase [Streptomyces sp. NRRL F-4489]